MHEFIPTREDITFPSNDRRHALILAGGVDASGRQCEVLLDAAVDACERYYQAFQFVVWAGTGAREAMDAAMFQTSGEA